MRNPVAWYRRVREALQQMDERDRRLKNLSRIMAEVDAEEARANARGLYTVACSVCDGTGSLRIVEHV